ncbi:TIGR04141 family sporadically distributed protein [Streptomyces brevispora]|uniref:TIGR04141 family sporadically distributed protein n=1 Tax=Streptomyces brevispora TaxID=887462 RepID=UPI0035D7F529
MITPDRRVELDLRHLRHDQDLSPGARRCCPGKYLSAVETGEHHPTVVPGASQTREQRAALFVNKANQIEICDFLTQDDTLVLVKQARGSGALSHLYNQARVAVEVLYDSAVARAHFAQRVRTASDGRRTLPDDFLPKRLVLAIHLKTGAKLTPDSLFGFSQITLAQTAKALAARGVSLEVVGISAAGSAADGGLADAA